MASPARRVVKKKDRVSATAGASHRENLIPPSMAILDALKIIDASPAKIALAVDANGRLLGTVTDGDVRRGILKGVQFHDPISRIMNPKPRVARQAQDPEAILEAMKAKKIHQMPVLDERGRVVRLEVLDDLLKPSSRPHWVVLMVGGFGTRLRPLTEDCPKPMLNVGKKPILETILENFKENGFRRFFMSVHYKNEMLKEHFGDGSRWGVQIEYLHEEKKLGTAGALGLLPKEPQHPLLVMNGDLLTKIDFGHLLNFHVENRVTATMCVREYDFQVPYGVVKIDKNQIQGIDEKPVHRFFVNAGIYVLEPFVLRDIPKNKPLDMPALFEKLIAHRRPVGAFPVREYWLDIGRLDDLERANGDFPEVFE